MEKNKRPRRISIQPYVSLDENGKPTYHAFESKVEGCIDSFVKQYSEEPE